MTPHAPPNSAQDGFILIEVLVSAVILALVAGAVLTLITATTRSAASARGHSVAYGLAQEDQARMRTLRLSTLKKYENLQTPTIGGTEFKVVSKAFFVNHESGTASCTEQNSSTDYVEITSTVSSTAMPHPVTLQSIVSPSSSSLDSTHGSLVFQVNNALGEGISGVPITASGASTFGGSTESAGCATFADIASGNYKVTATANGLISPEGSSTYIKEQVGAPAGGTQQVLINFDKAGTIAASFVYNEPAYGELKPAPVDAMQLIEGELGKTVPYGTPNLTNRNATLVDAVAYPFKTAYGVYAGSCPSNNPDPEGKKINTAALVSVPVTAGGTSAATIQVPALNLTVTNSSGKAVQGATVFLTDTSCKYNGTNVKREFTTNEIGHIALTSTEPAPVKTQAVGLPFGNYNICVQARVSGETRKGESSGVAVNNLTTAKTAAVSLNGKGGC
jgi:Tfp pilus assembly protein PilV